MEMWKLWYPGAGAAGLPFARCRLDPAARVALLAGGEAGTLKTWWNADDGSEWRRTVQFYNHR